MRKHALTQTAEGGESLRALDRLTADEEKELSKRILAGEAAKEALSKTEGLCDADRAALERAAEEGKLAYDALVLANLPRASKIAAETIRKNPGGLNEFEDYQQTALKVICSCAKTYDWRIGCRFGTYVHRCLIHEMMRENAKTGYALRVPEEYLPRLGALKQRSDAIGFDKAAEALGLSRENAANLLLAGSISRSLQDPASTDDPDTELGDIIADTCAVTAEEIEAEIDREEQINRLRTALSILGEDERSLLLGRMGFGGDPLPMRAFVGTVAGSVSGVQKKQIAAEKHLREIYFSLPMAD